MVICLIALPVLLVLSIFSATHRKLAVEAIQCIFKKITFKPCDLTFEHKLKKGVFGFLFRRNEKLAFLVFKHFEIFSIIFGLLMVLSFAGTALGVYNFAVYGNCNGPATSEFCVFNPETYSSGIEFFGLRFFEVKHFPKEIKAIELGDAPTLGKQNAPIQVIEVGCFTCPFTRAAEPIVKEFLEKHEGEVFFAFKYFPLPNHPYSFEAAASAECAREQQAFWEYKKKLFEHQAVCIASDSVKTLNQQFTLIAKQLNLDEKKFSECVESKKYDNAVEKHKQQAIAAGIYGTPTFYINGKVLVAPKSFQELEQAISGE